MTQKTRDRARTWLHRYGRDTFVTSWDVQAAAVVLVATSLLFGASEQSRHHVDVALAATVGVCAGLLGLVLGAIAIVTAFITRSFVAAISDLDEALMPFRTVAAVAAAGIAVSVTGLVIEEPAHWLIVSGVGALALGLTAWTVAGVVQLVSLVVYFSSLRARELGTLLEAEEIRQRRLQAR